MKRRRLLITGVLLLLGGAIVNVAVAWGCAASFDWSYENIGDNTDVEISPLLLEPFVSLGVLPCENVHWAVGSSSGFHDFVFVATSRETDIQTVNHDTFLVRTGSPFRAFVGIANQMTDFEHYPVRRGHLMLEGVQTTTVPYGAIVFKPFGNESRFVPTHVLWPGFAINTIFYAAILWVVFFVPGMVRRRIRRRRGRCPACAYPIGASPVCTECGAAIGVLPKGS